MLDKHGKIYTESDETARIMRDPTFRTLVKERTGFGWTMSGIMLVAYLGFILLSAYDNAFMSSMVGGSSISWGILLGLGVILFAFAMTGIYVARANSRYDALTSQIRGDLS